MFKAQQKFRKKELFSALAMTLLLLSTPACGRFSAENPLAPVEDLVSDKGNDDQTVVYGSDSRREAHYISNATVQNLSRLSVALISSKALHQTNGRLVEIAGDTLQENENLCSTEKFLEQRTSAFCSGILIDANHVLTAGHCVFTEKECADTRFVFGYEYYLGSSLNYKVDAGNIYSCKRVVAAAQRQISLTGEKSGYDFSIVELDRAVPSLLQVTINVEDNLKPGEGVFTLGYPVGLPKKFADGRVSSNKLNDLYFRASLDTYGGNSGSPVFNGTTGALEGILVSGEDDFVVAPGKSCRVSHRCVQGDCVGEEVLKISKIKKYLSEIQ